MNEFNYKISSRPMFSISSLFCRTMSVNDDWYFFNEPSEGGGRESNFAAPRASLTLASSGDLLLP